MRVQQRRVRLPGRWLVPAVLMLVVAALLVMAACAPAAAPAGGMPAVDSPAPDFTLTDLDGSTVSLKDFRGQVVFLNFWATWCGPCRAEMPDIETLHRKYRDRGVIVLGVDLRETRETVRAFVEEGGYTWTFLLDTTGGVGTRYGVRGIPSSFFVDRQGVIRAVAVGTMTGAAMEASLARAME